MTDRRVVDGALIPIGTETVNLNSTAQSLSSTAQVADALHVSVENADARYWAGSTPTQSAGVLLSSGVDHHFYGHNIKSQMKFVSVNSTASKLSVQSFGHIGHAQA